MYDYTPYMYRSRKREKMKKTRKNYDENDPISAIHLLFYKQPVYRQIALGT